MAFFLSQSGSSLIDDAPIHGAPTGPREKAVSEALRVEGSPLRRKLTLRAGERCSGLIDDEGFDFFTTTLTGLSRSVLLRPQPTAPGARSERGGADASVHIVGGGLLRRVWRLLTTCCRRND
jgi:hypothetical protein